MPICRGRNVAPHFIEVSVHHHALVTLPPGKNPSVNLMGRWVDPRAALEEMEMVNISCRCRDRPDRPLYRLSKGFGGLVVSMLASGTQVRGFKPGRSRRIFRAKKSSACLSSEGK
jgi:hypothetical protein